MGKFSKIINISQPFLLLAGFVFFSLGASIAKYLGAGINWRVYLFGQCWVTTLQLGTHFLYRLFIFPINNANKKNGLSYDDNNKDFLTKETLLGLTFTFFAILTSLTFVMVFQGLISVIVSLLMVVAFLGSIFYVMLPFRFIWSGYGELLFSILISFFIPAFAFILQYGEFHRFLTMATFPLVLLFLSGLIVSEFPTYASDVKYEERNLVVRMGWEKAMNLHNLLILFAYLLFAFSSFYGFPLFALFSGLLSLPLGLLQIYQMYRIQHGEKPNWKSFILLSKLLVILFTYFISFSFWVH